MKPRPTWNHDMLLTDFKATDADRGVDRIQEPPALRPLVALLHQLHGLIESLTVDEFTRKPVGVVESSIGGHVRHNLDHVEALLRGLAHGEVNYDHRDRGTAIERDRLAALDAIKRMVCELMSFPWHCVPADVTLTTMVSPELPPIVVPTSQDRELAFVVSHTIHHNALIRVMVKLLGVVVPKDFGYAPATVVHRRSRTCAR